MISAPSFWDDPRAIEDLTYRLLSGESVPIPTRVPKPHIDLHLPPQLVQLDHFLRNPSQRKAEGINGSNSAAGAPVAHGYSGGSQHNTPVKGSTFSTPVKSNAPASNALRSSPYAMNRVASNASMKTPEAQRKKALAAKGTTATSKPPSQQQTLTHVASAPSLFNATTASGVPQAPPPTVSPNASSYAQYLSKQQGTTVSPRAGTNVHTPFKSGKQQAGAESTSHTTSTSATGVPQLPLPTQAPVIQSHLRSPRSPRLLSTVEDSQQVVMPVVKRLHLSNTGEASNSGNTTLHTSSIVASYVSSNTEPPKQQGATSQLEPPVQTTHHDAYNMSAPCATNSATSTSHTTTNAVAPSNPALGSTMPSSKELNWSVDRIPPNNALIGSRREKYDLTLKRLANQKPVDPDFIFGGRNFEVPLTEIFQHHKTAVMQFGPDPRGKSGDWFADHFDVEEEYEYKLAAKMVHICPSTRSYG